MLFPITGLSSLAIVVIQQKKTYLQYFNESNVSRHQTKQASVHASRFGT